MGDEREMMRAGNGKMNGIWHVVRLRGMLQKWQSTASAPNKGGGHVDASAAAVHVAVPSSGIVSGPAVVDKRLKRVAMACGESDDESCSSSPEPPPDVPQGYLAVYVGQEHRRFVIPTTYLGEPAFKELLRKAEEEFGFEHDGAITFPCEVETFKYILHCTRRPAKQPGSEKEAEAGKGKTNVATSAGKDQDRLDDVSLTC